MRGLFEDVRNRRARQPPAHFHRDPPGRGRSAQPDRNDVDLADEFRGIDGIGGRGPFRPAGPRRTAVDSLLPPALQLA